MSRNVVGAQAVVRLPGSTQCPQHRNHELAFICEDCGDNILCPLCLKQHNRHSVISLMDKVQKKSEYLQTFIQKAETQMIGKIRKEIEMTEREQVENSKHFKNLVSKVEKRSEDIKSRADDMKVKYMAAYREMEQVNATLLKKYLDELNANLQQLENYLKESKHTLQIGSPIQVYDTCTEILKADFKLPIVPELKSADDKEKEIGRLMDHLKEMFGSLTGHVATVPTMLACPKGIEQQVALPHLPAYPGTRPPPAVPNIPPTMVPTTPNSTAGTTEEQHVILPSGNTQPAQRQTSQKYNEGCRTLRR